MTEELKVTVVATGLGSEVARAPLQVVETSKPVEVDLEPNYKDLDRPAIGRRRAAVDGRAAPASPDTAGGEDYFDIPAFLRRQAD